MKKTCGDRAAVNPFTALTWMDLEEWAGIKIVTRGKSYQRSGRVEDLGITSENELVAWVHGDLRYATQVSYRNGKLSSVCTCPYGTDCKHAVAVVIDYLQAIKEGKTIPLLPKKDERLKMIKENLTISPEELEEALEDELEGEQDMSAARRSDGLEAYLKGKSKAEVAKILIEIVKNHPHIEMEIFSKPQISLPSAARIVKMISKKIDQVSGEPAWSSHWSNAGHIPDYSSVRKGLQALYDSGHFDEAVHLGQKLYIKGNEQINQSNDEGETIDEVRQALDIVFKALKHCSLSTVEKIYQAIEWELADEFSLTSNLESFWKTRFKAKEWSAIADLLLKRLDGMHPAKEKQDFHYRYTREKLTDQIIRALENSGRGEEILSLCIQEAPITESYPRLVTLLRKSNQDEIAEDWIRNGIRATRDCSPGIAAELVDKMLEIHKAKKDWPFCAAIVATRFFESQEVDVYAELKRDCERIGVWDQVRCQLLRFLDTGVLPSGKEWPLPETGIALGQRRHGSQPPFIRTLIEIALLEKDIDEALRLYDADLQNKKKSVAWAFSAAYGLREQIAEAAKNKYPDRSIAIWKEITETHINRTLPAEYAAAYGYLKKIQKVMVQNGRESEFKAYIVLLRAQHIRKIRLIERLDSLIGGRIVDG